MRGTRLAILLVLPAAILASGAWAGSPSSADHSIAAGRCFWIHGRLSAANGAPTFRIRRSGTKRILGVKADEGADAAIEDLPEPLRVLVSPDAFRVSVDGDFRVCPLTKDRPGHMRFIRIDRTRHLIARPAGSGPLPSE